MGALHNYRALGREIRHTVSAQKFKHGLASKLKENMDTRWKLQHGVTSEMLEIESCQKKIMEMYPMFQHGVKHTLKRMIKYCLRVLFNGNSLDMYLTSHHW